MALSVEEAMARADRDMRFSQIIDQLRTSTGDSFAGGWIDGPKVYVGVTKQALVDEVTAAGATPVVVSNSLSKLEKARDAFDQVMTSSTGSANSAGIASSYVDVVINKVVVEALADSRGHAENMASQAGVAATDFEVRTVETLPTIKGST
ncbi:hypothetical protein VHEMI02769 [[Torrubiella] hemipterigena]|uniref:Peptidase S1A alpha-lytic prodomain domain-containing protein n=1 Tax=[Torrubiella] hemipterigena TaxID=1531966 RepID=A0A0A1T990_9HYPO|nr:hypothetical protein VHEMI02769 [[Torrubiella] hemipterigena]